MILRDIIKPNNKEITSYVLKNIILWQAENTPQTEFHSRSLLYWLHDGLKKLRTAIEKKRLCYYMIPERNLMDACGMHDYKQHKWVADITDMLEEGPKVILRLEKIRKAIVASPEPMLWFSRKRMELEMMSLEMKIRAAQCMDEIQETDDSDSILKKIMIHQLYLCIEVTKGIILNGSTVNDLIDIYYRMLM
ncbi:hypothetical protein DPMN_040126 [Dreissena polymorpha]|uniref:Mab-21-like HhH/H2TH-like domain-containing protein n=1 Tax=Dreissena polymorpha TaxID=45954 RepID=A0A9D4CUG3_DREPO|nr:hypothetical protein DPMN_040126 [Dreissena polymorpha]